MTLENLRKLLSEGEGLTVEFKKCVTELSNSVFETVCSFSNRYGGHMLLGIDDNGDIIGVKPAAAQAKRDSILHAFYCLVRMT